MLSAILLTLFAQAKTDATMVPSYMDATIRTLVAGRIPESLTKDKKAALRREVMQDLGIWPEPARTALNPKVTGVLERDGYTVEKLIYETFPKFYATAYLYLPKPIGTTRRPAVVSPVGHWSKKKLEPVVQARCIGLVKMGFVVLCIDMPGFVGPNDDERNFPGTHNDWTLHMSSLPPLGPMVWDIVRGIDYLETRKEVDKNRIGVTGESGGGMDTMYVGAIDPRVTCYSPVCYATSYEVNYNNGCYCNHVPGAMLIGDRSDIMALAAPRPILLIGATNDAEFPREGTLRSHEKLSKFYANPADCEVLLVEGGHDYSKPMREKMYGFMKKHLMGEGNGSAIPEPAMTLEDPKAAASQVFPNGKAPADAKSLRAMAKEKAAKLAADAEIRVKTVGQLRERFNKLYPHPQRVQVDPKVDLVVGRNMEQTTGSFVSEPGLRIPFLLTKPPGGKLPVRIVIAEGGIGDPFAMPVPMSEPTAEMRIDGRGFGSIPGLDMRLATYVGRPDVVMWAWDVSRAVDYLATRSDIDMKRIEVWGFGPGAGQVPYLAALLDARIAKAYGQRTLRSYQDAFDRGGLPQYALPHRILEVGDLPLMRRLLTK